MKLEDLKKLYLERLQEHHSRLDRRYIKPVVSGHTADGIREELIRKNVIDWHGEEEWQGESGDIVEFLRDNIEILHLDILPDDPYGMSVLEFIEKVVNDELEMVERESGLVEK